MAAASVVLPTKRCNRWGYKEMSTYRYKTLLFCLNYLLEQSDLLAVLPERLIGNLPNLKRFEPLLKIQGFTKTLIWHERTHKDPAYKWIRELIEKACLIEEE